MKERKGEVFGRGEYLLIPSVREDDYRAAPAEFHNLD